MMFNIKKSKKLCIYHGNCLDGFAAAWVMHYALGENIALWETLVGIAGWNGVPHADYRKIQRRSFLPSMQWLPWVQINMPFCPECDDTRLYFKSNKGVRIHLRKIHPNSSWNREQVDRCPECGHKIWHRKMKWMQITVQSLPLWSNRI